MPLLQPVLGLGLALCLSMPARADTNSRDWLVAMSQAMHQLNYEGELIYQQGQRLEILHQKHWVEAAGEHEQLTNLNGPLRELVRDKEGARCRLSNNESVAVSRLSALTGFPSLTSLADEGLERFYRIEFTEQARLAGRETQGIEIRPKDELRYGFRIYLDRENQLPLKQMLLDAQGEPLMSLIYSRLVVTRPTHPGSIRQPVPEQPKIAGLSGPAPRGSSGWNLSALPPGFRVVWQKSHPTEEGLDHLVLSDGLASVSLYVAADARTGLEGPLHLGITGAYGRRLGKFQITAVGEVPEAALRWMAEAVRLP